MWSHWIYCDNQGVLAHGNSPRLTLPQKQAQSDLIYILKSLVRNNTIRTHWEWVESHAVEERGWAHCTLAEKMNFYADELAKLSLQSAIARDDAFDGDFLLESIRFSLSGKRVTGSPSRAIVACELFNKKQIIHEMDFHLVWWKGVEAVMNG